MLSDKARITMHQSMDARLPFLQVERLHPVTTQRGIIGGKETTAERLNADTSEDCNFGQRESAWAGGAPAARIL